MSTPAQPPSRRHLYFASNFWDALWITQQPTCWEIQKSEDVVFVERFVSVFTILRYPRMWSRLFTWMRGRRRVSDRLVLVAPLPLFHLGHRFPRVFGLEFGIQLLWLRLLGVFEGGKPVVLWIDNPMLGCAVGRMGEDLVVYHVADEFGEFPTSHGPTARSLEHTLLTKADIVFAAAEQLAKEKRKVNPNTFTVLNAIDATLFSDPTVHVPDTIIDHIPNPRVVFVGVVDEWVDTSLLRLVAARLPRFHLVVVGPGAQSDPHLVGMSNVHAVGPRPRAQIPGILRSCAASLVPFKQTALTARILPLKIFEALAAGIQPVCTAFSRELDGLAASGLVRVASTPGAFADAVKEAVAQDTPATRDRLARYGLAQTWASRWQQMSQLVTSALAARRAGSHQHLGKGNEEPHE